jgi:hypothetical protein
MTFKAYLNEKNTLKGMLSTAGINSVEINSNTVEMKFSSLDKTFKKLGVFSKKSDKILDWTEDYDGVEISIGDTLVISGFDNFTRDDLAASGKKIDNKWIDKLNKSLKRSLDAMYKKIKE